MRKIALFLVICFSFFSIQAQDIQKKWQLIEANGQQSDNSVSEDYLLLENGEFSFHLKDVSDQAKFIFIPK